MPSISVIMCVRDGETFVGDALDSIANQGIEDLETVIVDDGSQDNSAQIIRTHALKPTIVSQGPLGVSAALNIGIRSASGHLLAFLDCDDVWPRGRLDAMLAAFEQNTKIDFVFGKVVNTDRGLNEISRPQPAKLAGAMLIKRASALKIGELRTDLTHGIFIDWISRAAALGLCSHSLEEVVLLRRIHGNNMGIRYRLKARADLLRIVRDHLERRRR